MRKLKFFKLLALAAVFSLGWLMTSAQSSVTVTDQGRDANGVYTLTFSEWTPEMVNKIKELKSQEYQMFRSIEFIKNEQATIKVDVAYEDVDSKVLTEWFEDLFKVSNEVDQEDLAPVEGQGKGSNGSSIINN